MAGEDPHVDIGRLRWPVQLFDLVQTAQAAGTGIDETLANPVTLYADVQWVGAVTFRESKQTDTPLTHRIFVRWHDYLQTTKAILRTTRRPDGSLWSEVFRVHRVKPLGGRTRFALVECELLELDP